MAETKAGAMDRLRREGRWDKATAFREQERDRLRAEGQKKAEAREAAWQRMIEEFPPLPAHPMIAAGEEPGILQQFAITAETFAGKPPETPLMAVEWVGENLAKADASPEDAPGRMAWGLLLWAKTDPSAFWANLWPRVLPSRRQLECEARYVDDGRVLRLVEELLAATAGREQEWS